ncbi:MAG: hypothetical protein EAX87_02220 [Candidatus Thorarchaeota archaeon]|nr:hypothetical protein [Candidatus Thorarchaeota archaeon]
MSGAGTLILILLPADFVGGFYTPSDALKTMGVQVKTHAPSYMVYDIRGISEPDEVYEAATKIADEVMGGIERLSFSNTIETATLFITNTGAQLILLAHSFDESLIASAFRSTLKGVSYDPETGYIQRYVIPILDVDLPAGPT